MFSKPTCIITAGNVGRRLVIGTAVVIVDGLANGVVVNTKDTVSIA